MTITVKSFDSKAALLDAMEACLREAFEEPGAHPFAVMISGGNTPLPVYENLAKKAPNVSANAGIMFADDRHVPVDSPESNYGNALPMIKALGILEGKTLRIHPELSLEEAADRYNNDIQNFMSGGGTIPVAFLGLGADGHTCSLFNDADLERCKGRYAAPAYKDTPPNRITVGPEVLARVERVVFVVAGDDKIEMINALLERPETITAGKATARCRNVELWRA